MQIIKPTDARRRQPMTRVDGLLPALVGHADVGPARELVLGVPLGLAVPEQHEHRARPAALREARAECFFIFCVPGLAQARVAQRQRRGDFGGGLGRRVGVLLVVGEAVGQFRVRALAVHGRREAEGRHDASEKALLRPLRLEVLERPLEVEPERGLRVAAAAPGVAERVEEAR